MKRSVTVCFIVFVFFCICNGHAQGKSDQLEKVRVTLSSTDYPVFTGLVHLAQEQGFFTESGLDVDFHFVPSGVGALQELQNGNCDIASAAEFPFVRQILQGSDMKLLASVAEIDVVELIARQDRGISKPADIQGKKVGVVSGSQLEFFLARFLLNDSLSLENIEMVHLLPPAMVTSMVEGTVDAVIIREPFLGRIQEGVRDSAILHWPAQNTQAIFWILAGSEQFITLHPQTVEKFLHAIQHAESLYLSDPEQSIEKLIQYEGLDQRLFKILQSKITYTLFLRQELLLALEDEARWLIESQHSDAEEVPNFLEAIYFDALEVVKPDGVDIVH